MEHYTDIFKTGELTSNLNLIFNNKKIINKDLYNLNLKDTDEIEISRFLKNADDAIIQLLLNFLTNDKDKLIYLLDLHNLKKKMTIKDLKKIIANSSNDKKTLDDLNEIIRILTNLDSTENMKITKIMKKIPPHTNEAIKIFINQHNLNNTILNKLSIENIENIKKFINISRLVQNLRKINPSLLKLDLSNRYDSYILYRYRIYDNKFKNLDINSQNELGMKFEFKVRLHEVHRTLKFNNRYKIILLNDGKLLVSDNDAASAWIPDLKIKLSAYLKEQYSNFTPQGIGYISIMNTRNILLPKSPPTSFIRQMPGRNKKTIDLSVIQNEIKLDYTNILLGDILSKQYTEFANVINNIKYLFYHKKKFFLDDHLSIRDNTALAKQYSILSILAYNTNYDLLFRIINTKAQRMPGVDNLTIFINNNLSLDLFINFSKLKILDNFDVNNKSKDTELTDIYYKTREEYKKDFDLEIRLIIKNLIELISYIGNINGNIFLVALMNFMINQNDSNTYVLDLANDAYFSGTENDENKYPLIVDYVNSKKSDKFLDRISWNFFNKQAKENLCSETTLFQLLCCLILDYSKKIPTKLDEIIEKIKIPLIKDFFNTTSIYNFYKDPKKSYNKIITAFHKILKTILAPVKSKLEDINLDFAQTFIKINYGKSTSIHKELPGHILYIYILLDIIFNSKKIYTSDYNPSREISKEFLNFTKTTPTFDDFYNLLSEINPKITILNKKNPSKSMVVNRINPDEFTFTVKNIDFMWHSGHGDTKDKSKPFLMQKLKILLDELVISNNSLEYLVIYIIKSNQYGIYPFGDDDSYLNILYYSNVLKEASFEDINQFINSANNSDESDEINKYLLNNYDKMGWLENKKFNKIKLDENDSNINNILVDFYKETHESIGETGVISILKNDNYDDSIFLDIDNLYIKKKSELSKLEIYKKIIKDTTESILNDVFLKEIFSNYKSFKMDFIKKIYASIKDAVNTSRIKCNKNIKEKHNKITPNKVKVILKGGINFYSLYYTFLNKIDRVYPKLKKFLEDKIEKNKRSDYDFIILIDPTLEDDIYYNLFKEINKQVTIKSIYYQQILEKNMHILLDLTTLANDIKYNINQKIMESSQPGEYIKTIDIKYMFGNRKIQSNDSINIASYISSNNKLFDLNKNEDMSEPESKRLEKKIINLKQSPIKKNYYVTNFNKNGVLIPMVNMLPGVANSIYYYANESLLFYSNKDDLSKKKNPNNFYLHRIKKNIKVTCIDKKKSVYFFNTGIELLDISVPTKLDFYHLNSTIDFAKTNQDMLKMYNYKDNNIILYTVEGLIYDYNKILFLVAEYPWDDNKYFKRLDRFIILLTIHNIDNLDEFKKFIKSITQIKNAGSNDLSSKINKMVIDNLTKLKNKINELEETEKLIQDKSFDQFISNISTSFNEIIFKIEPSTYLSKIHKINTNYKKMKTEWLIYKYLINNILLVKTLKKLLTILTTHKNSNNDLLDEILSNKEFIDTISSLFKQSDINNPKFKQISKNDIEKKIVSILNNFILIIRKINQKVDSKIKEQIKKLLQTNLKEYKDNIIQKLINNIEYPFKILSSNTVLNIDKLLNDKLLINDKKDIELIYMSKHKFK